MDRGGTGWRLALVLAVALAVRVIAAFVVQASLPPGEPDLIPGDASGYLDLADDIAAGREFAVYIPPRHVLRMPGFPALLAGSTLLFGPSPIAARLVLAAIGTLGCYLVFVLGRRLFDERLALIGAAITAVLPTFVGFTPLFLSETVFGVTLVASLIPAATLLMGLTKPETTNSTTLCRAGSCGALIGLACYMRPSWLLWAPFVAALAVVAGRARGITWIAAITIGATTLLTLVPWALRNQRVTGHFVLTTLWMGPSLYDGLNPDATGDSEMSFFDRENLMGQMSEYDVNREYARRAREFAWNNPGRAIELGFKKLGRYWSLWPNAGQFNSWKHWALMLASSLPLFLATLIGLWRYRTNWIVLAITLGPVLYFAAVHAVFVGSIRYRLPAEYPMTLLAAAGVLAVVQSTHRQTE
ncbi:MAG TPA: glycosyltransferase family 39 protein [Caulifigura sp.]|nr:glycosyltransferase family 39 protein [Caulifigura sp.]